CLSLRFHSLDAAGEDSGQARDTHELGHVAPPQTRSGAIVPRITMWRYRSWPDVSSAPFSRFATVTARERPRWPLESRVAVKSVDPAGGTRRSFGAGRRRRATPPPGARF